MATVTTTRTPAELAQVVKDAIAAIDALEKGLGITAPSLSPTMKRHTARYRKGGDAVISTIGSIVAQNRLEFPRTPVSEMRNLMAIADTIERLRSRTALLQIHLAAMIFSARASAWQTAMQYYALLKRVARKNGEIRKTLEPVAKFMSMHDPRKKRQVGEPTRPAQRAAKKAAKVLERSPAAAEVGRKKQRAGG
jgi:hypothetical protein